MALVSDASAGGLSEIRLDYATYNPLSLILKEQKILEKAFEKDGISIVWVQSLGSNKALEFLNASSIDFGSTAGAAALLARLNGNPIKSVYVYSRPEWTALVTRKDTGIANVADLKGKRVAVTRGTDPHIFLVRALAGAGLTEKDVTVVPLQHQDGRAAHLAIIPLVILWFGIGEEAKIFLVAIGVFFPIYLNTFHGIRTVDKGLIEMARVYGLSQSALFYRVTLPGALPSILIGLRYSLGIMWLTLIVAETISASAGIGYMTMNAREFLQTDVVLLGVLIYAALGKMADALTRALENRVLRWHPSYQTSQKV